MAMSFELLISLVIMLIYAALMVFAFFRLKRPKEQISADPAKRFKDALNEL